MNRLLDIRVTDARESVRRTEEALQKAVGRRAAATCLQAALRELRLAQPWISQIKALLGYCQNIYFELPEPRDQERLKALTDETGTYEVAVEFPGLRDKQSKSGAQYDD